MATNWGPYVRVSGPGASLTVSGTIWARIVHAIAEGTGPTHADGASIGVGGGSVALRVEKDLSTGGLRCVGEVWCLDELAYTEATQTYWIDDPEYVYDPEHPEIVPESIQIGPSEVSLSYTISYTGLVLKCRHGISTPDNRQHMWAGDAHAMDTWHMTPDYQVHVNCTGPAGSVSLSSGARRDLPEFAGMTDAEIGDELFDIRYFLGMYSQPGAFGRDDDPLCILTVSGCNFDGIVTSMAGGDSGDAEAISCRVVGSGPTLTYYQDEPEVQAGAGYSVGIRTHPPARYAWDLKFCQFDDGATGEALDPLIDAGFLRATDDVGGTEPALFYASQLNAMGRS